ncbi:hypothetical protein BUALT_Bualt16G0108900 [Buddleja alternifolia]|uniref:VQ domain-containing protein n=1 Tax=Buddleja alternifolia TaxID=168488 RepID=A0AAV6WLB8_9LAMI|nr:hypothetical protein BUALT_Bualt16G0108900 [Buddleja alternifolia]
MAYSDNLMTMEQPWMFRSTFSDAWTSDFFTKETEMLTKALQTSIASTTSSNGDVSAAETFDSLYSKPEISPVQTPTISGASENEVSASKHRRSLPPSGRVAKRKPRASKRAATTTFFTADPANFRQMVQEVTGVNFGRFNGRFAVAPVLNGEDRTAANLLQCGGGLPTFDSSEFLLDGGNLSPVMANGGAAVAEHYFDSFCSFPTLESWKATM